MKLVIFDMDGTILNTLDDLAAAVNYALKSNGMPERSVDDVRFFVGNGLYKTLERAVPKGTDKEKLEQIFPDFIEYYKAHANVHTKPYDGIVETIFKLKSQGYMTAVVSNKKQEAVRDLCQAFFKDCFDLALGDKEGIPLKPAPDMVEYVLKTLKVDRSQAVYVGDSDVDLLTAKNSGLACIAVSWGFRGEEFLKEHGAEYICKDPTELLEYIKKIEASL